MSSGCTTAGSTLAQWVAAARWSLLTQFFRLSGIRPGKRGERRMGPASCSRRTQGGSDGDGAAPTGARPSGRVGPACQVRVPTKLMDPQPRRATSAHWCLLRRDVSELTGLPRTLTGTADLLKGGQKDTRTPRTTREHHRQTPGAPAFRVCGAGRQVLVALFSFRTPPPCPAPRGPPPDRRGPLQEPGAAPTPMPHTLPGAPRPAHL